MRVPLAGAIAAAGLLTLVLPVDPAQAAPVAFERPDRAVAVDQHGRLVRLDTADGEIDTVLAQATLPLGKGEPNDGTVDESDIATIEAVALSPDGDDVYFTRRAYLTGSRSIHKVDWSETETEVTPGATPAVSPDGRRLAFVRGSSIVVRDLHTDEEQAWSLSTDLFLEDYVNSISWAPDSQRLVYALAYEGAGMWLLDTARHINLSQAEQIPGDWSGSFVSTGRVVAVEQCCWPAYDAQPGRVVEVDPATGQARPLATSAGMTRTAAHVLEVEPDLTGTNLLVVRQDGNLDMVGPDGDVVRLGAGYRLAAW